MKKHSIQYLMVLLPLLLLIVGCPFLAVPEEAYIDESSLYLNIDDEAQLTIYTEPNYAQNYRAEWTSSNESVATVSEDGIVVAKNPGKITISVKIYLGGSSDDLSDFLTDSIDVTVRGTAIESIEIEGASKRVINQNETIQLVAKILPSNATRKSITWESSNPAVATVSATGLVMYVSPGTTTIKAIAAGDTTKTDSVIVSAVKESPYYISFKYRNVNGSSPEIEMIDEKTSSNISITSKNVTMDNGAVLIKFNNFSIVDENTYYVVEDGQDVKTQYLENDNWVTDVEFNTTVTKKNNVCIVLVLDKSRSISDSDFIQIKKYAHSFIDIIYANNPTAKVGLVSFSNYSQIATIGVNQLNASTGYYRTHIGDLKDHVTAMTKGEFTALYSAIDTAYGLIPNYSVYDGCAIVSFTDGINNDSRILLNELVTKLNTPNNLKNFSIGFGDVKDSELTALAVNGAYRKATNIIDLQTIFNSFSKAVSTFHDLTLRRSSGIVSDWVEMKLSLNAVPK